MGMTVEGNEVVADEFPLRSIWIRPRETLRSRLADPGRPQLLEYGLACAAGISTVTNLSALLGLGRQIPFTGVLVVLILAGPLLGLAAMYFDGAALTLIGRLIGGHGSPSQVRLVFAWSNAPRLIDLALWIVLLAAYGGPLFSSRLRPARLTQLGPVGGLLLVLATGLMAWIYFLWVVGLAEAHQFSAWSALVTLLLARLIVGALAVTCTLVLPVALFWGAAL